MGAEKWFALLCFSVWYMVASCVMGERIGVWNLCDGLDCV